MRKVRLFVALLAVAALAVGSASATPGQRTGGTGTASCNDDGNGQHGTVTWTPTTVWPPNHKMQTVVINYTEPDNDGDRISITVDSIKHDQAAADGTNEVQGSGSPTEGLDWGGVGNTDTAVDSDTATGSDREPATTTAQIRAERSGTIKAGRTYTITVTCTDMGDKSHDNPQMQTIDLRVTVPHDQGHH